jgi:hypothetical protein
MSPERAAAIPEAASHVRPELLRGVCYDINRAHRFGGCAVHRCISLLAHENILEALWIFA